MDIIFVFAILVVFILLGVPVAFSMGIATFLALLIDGSLSMLPVIGQRIYSGGTGFVLLAIPFYILSGLLMNGGGMTDQLMKASDILVGRLPGGLAHVNILTSMLFSGMSGSSVADASGVGSVEIEMMEKAGYDRDFSAAITAASATIGPVIPPSIPFVIYGAISGVSIGKLFLGGLIPGVAMGIGLAIAVAILSIIRKYPRSTVHYGFVEIIVILLKAIVPMGSFIIIIFGISEGWFTATEAAIVACLYAMALGTFVYRSLTLKAFMDILKETIRNSVRVILIIAVAAAYAYALTILQVPQRLSAALTAIAVNPVAFLLACNALLLLLGCFMETISIITLVTPILLPIATSIGIDPVHFGVIMVLNLMIGQLTPPVGILLYSVVTVSQRPMKGILKELWPYILALFCVLMVITFVPWFSTYIPSISA